MKRLIIKILFYLSKFIKMDDNLIIIMFQGYSGSNLSPIIEQLKGKRYHIEIISDRKVYSNYYSNKISKCSLYKHMFRKYILLLKSKLVISTHGCYRLRSDNIMINLWHGIPIKSMGLMHKSKTDSINSKKDDYIISTSVFYNTIMNACFGVCAEKYFVTGYPRNDYLFNQDGLENLKTLIKKEINGKIILFMPTYRGKNNGSMELHNIFGFDNFDIDGFNDFLVFNKLTLIIKLHPNDEKSILENYSQYINDTIFLIKSDDLDEQEMDFYKIINSVDLLITDYSSVYFDFLLLNRPIIFTPTDYDKYNEDRGLLLEPYDFWTPGPKCLCQKSLQEEIFKSLHDKDYYQNEREMIMKIMHKYEDGNSTERVMKLIEDIMSR